MKRSTLLGWLLIGLAGFALMGSDSECFVDVDDDGIEIDVDDDDDFDFDDIFDKGIRGRHAAVRTQPHRLAA